MDVKTIRSDKIIATALNLVMESQEGLNLQKYTEEMKILHDSRPGRKLYKMALEPTRLSDASMKDMANRARLSEMKANVFAQKAALDKAYAEALDHLCTKYARFIADSATNATDRKHVTNKILSRLRNRIAELQASLDQLDIYMVDIDKAGWSLRLAMDAYTSITERAGRVV